MASSPSLSLDDGRAYRTGGIGVFSIDLHPAYADAFGSVEGMSLDAPVALPMGGHEVWNRGDASWMVNAGVSR